MIVEGYSLPQVAVDGVQTRLYPHQAATLNQWHDHDAFMLVTKTGSGKTRAVALPVLKNRESAVFVYPTNSLIADQAQSIQQLMREENIRFREWTPERANEKFADEEYVLVQISAETLEEFRKKFILPHKGDPLKQLLSGDKRRIILINPDSLFFIFSLRYSGSAEAIGHLQNYSTVIFDEFHLYTGVELAHILFMIHLTRQMNVFKRVVLLSATPNAQVKTHLDALLHPRMIDATVAVPQTIVGGRTVAHEVDLLPIPVTDKVVETAVTEISTILDELYQLREANKEANSRGEYVPCVVILNSVINAIVLEDILVATGIDREDIVPIRGLSARSSRDTRDKLLVIGTSAIEVGIDFKADYLMFEAGDAPSFMQRFGRIGRHRPGKALLLCKHQEAAALQSFGDKMTRHTFEEAINSIYPLPDGRAWFVTTWSSFVTVCAQAHMFKQQVEKDWSADEAIKLRVTQWIEEVLSGYAICLGQESTLKRALRATKKPWFAHYIEINSFRTSLPSQRVWDLSEKRRDREPKYNADVKMLLHRAEGLSFDGKILCVKGYGKWRNVWINKSFDELSESEIGTIETTAKHTPDEMQFRRENEQKPSPISHIMYKPKHHIYFLAPLALKDDLDWRITWFRCGQQGRYMIAFDGDALLLKEILDSKR
ncbi:MAG TPA: type I-D CRISPR-associated helicase Cas3' [Chloroflexota bacterium]|nr:type I-D CRISPR-associated helicase Cas3' [Chloroflexota bacterium]HUM67999.1 type I-D CRISPR-associated helicase Cas3' [Chloroflexota bacterium]